MAQHKKESAVDSLFNPTTCKYKLDSSIREHVARIVDDSDTDIDAKNVIVKIMDEEESNKNLLTYESLVALHKYLQRADQDFVDPFYKFIDKCKCVEPKPRDNKQLDKRIKKLQQLSSQTLYNGMTASVDRCIERYMQRQKDLNPNLRRDASQEDQSTINEFKQLYGSLIAVFNSFLVFICTFVFFYKAVEYALPSPHYIAQVSFGIFGSLVVAVAELYFLMRVI